jgi:hypothetical protein
MKTLGGTTARRVGVLLTAGTVVAAIVTISFASPAFAGDTPGHRQSRAPEVIDTSRVVGPPHQTAARPESSKTLTSRTRGVAPAITSNPQNESVTSGSTASFSASASGTPTPTVRWQRSTNKGRTWSNVSGATSITYSFVASTSQNGYQYRAVFTNSAGSATTQAAVLTVTAASTAPAVTQQPSSETVAAGSTASFSASVSGSPTPTVAWQVSTDGGSSWNPISGATSTTYSFTAQSSDNNNEYEAVFTNAVSSATTDPATLTVTTPIGPQVTSDPQSQTVPSGSSASFSSSATGSPTPTVQWQVLTTQQGATWTDISGATSDIYSFTASLTQNGYEYEAVFTNSQGSVTTTAATLTVTAVGPSITTDPSSETVPSGSTASFSASATGSPTPTVQWQVLTTQQGATWTDISGATSGTYSFTATSAANGNQYQAVFTNAGGSATTTVATLTVTAALYKSSNWSGYADTGGPFTTVSGSWTAPTVNCSVTRNAYSAQWIGIDGFSSSTVEQDGTEADCVNGTPSYDAWYEMYGDSAVNSGYEVELSPSSYPVVPGDTMSASVSVAGTTWTLRVADTGKWSYSTTVVYSGAAESSAEWIVERPEICSFTCSLASLADFGTAQFSGASTTVNGVAGTISATSEADIEMVSGSTVLALPSVLDPAGDSFTDTWKAA